MLIVCFAVLCTCVRVLTCVCVVCVFVYVLSLCVFLSCVSAFRVRFIVCCSKAWFCFVFVRLNVLLESMCVSFVMYSVCVFCLVCLFVCVGVVVNAQS